MRLEFFYSLATGLFWAMLLNPTYLLGILIYIYYLGHQMADDRQKSACNKTTKQRNWHLGESTEGQLRRHKFGAVQV